MEENTFEKILTPQEHLLIGSGTLLEEERGTNINWYRPEAVSEGTAKDVSLARKRTGWYEGGMLGFMVGESHAAIRLNDLNSETGETTADPVVGVLNEKTDEYVERPDLTELLYRKLKEVGIDPRLREESTGIENKRGQGEMKG